MRLNLGGKWGFDGMGMMGIGEMIFGVAGLAGWRDEWLYLE